MFHWGAAPREVRPCYQAGVPKLDRNTIPQPAKNQSCTTAAIGFSGSGPPIRTAQLKSEKHLPPHHKTKYSKLKNTDLNKQTIELPLSNVALTSGQGPPSASQLAGMHFGKQIV